MAGDRKTLIIICGQTATGKSALGIKIARDIDGEVISADSMQVYRGLESLTFPPTKEEMAEIKHHFISFLDPKDSFDVATFVRLAYERAMDIWSRGKAVIIVGGTGFYIKSLMYGIFQEETRDESIRAALLARIEAGEDLYKELSKIDPLSARKIHPNDKRRILRALEVFYKTGKPISYWKNKPVYTLKDKCDFSRAVILYMEKAALIERIERRVTTIRGDTVERLEPILRQGLSKTARQVIGIRQVEGVLRGEISLKSAREQIVKETYQYARRQMIWFRNQPCGTRLVNLYNAEIFLKEN